MSEAPGRARAPDLPTWPFYALFVGFPLFWLLGLGTFAGTVCAVPMLGYLWARGRVRLPREIVPWLVFLLCALLAVVMLDSPLRLIGFGVRVSNYLAATVLLVYLMNCSSERLPMVKMVGAMCAFFAFVVLGGWLGVVAPHGRLDTPLAHLLPGAITSNEYVTQLVRPAFAEVQQPYGSPRTFARPSAPFAYTNGWGVNVALLVPFALAGLAAFRLRGKVLMAVVLCAALVPAAATLNRGMLVALSMAVLYVSIRLALRGRFATLLAIVAVTAVIGTVVVTSGTLSRLQERLHYSQTNVGRLTIYGEAWHGALESPLLGNGAPRPSQTLDISIGTQGQIWNVMFSYGLVALAGWLLFFGWSAWSTRRWRSSSQLWVHAVVLLAVVTSFFYGYDGPQLWVAVVAVAAALRARPPRSRRLPGPPPPVRTRDHSGTTA
ncbi:hypothetical protein GCM10027446_13870 [Angustibacter peucedani]